MGVVIKRALCMKLRTAGLVIAYLGFFSAIWQIGRTFQSIYYFGEYLRANYEDSEPSEEDSNQYNLLFVILVAYFVDGLTSFFLLLGIKQNSHKLFLPWLVLKGAALTILVVSTTLSVFVGLYLLLDNHGGMVLVSSILLSIVAGLLVYLFLVIYSLYCDIRDSKQKPQQVDPENLYLNSNVTYDKN